MTYNYSTITPSIVVAVSLVNHNNLLLPCLLVTQKSNCWGSSSWKNLLYLILILLKVESAAMLVNDYKDEDVIEGLEHSGK